MPKLTKTIVDRAELRDRQYVVWCSELKGFGCYTHPSGPARSAGLLGGIFSFAVSEGIIKVNPASGVVKPAGKRRSAG